MEQKYLNDRVAAARRASELLADLRKLGANHYMPEELSIRGDTDLLAEGGLEQLAKDPGASQSTPAE